MATRTSTISLETKGDTDIIDISQRVADFVQAGGIRDGIVTIFCPSSTSAVTTIEYESGCLTDLKRLFERVAPQEFDYAHNARWGDGNGFSHVRAALLGASLSIPVLQGRLTLGMWQQIVYVDFDNRPRHRELVIQLMGD